MKVRLVKRIAESGVASRREAERLISEGRVSVDGEIVTTPVFFVSESQQIAIDERPIRSKSAKLIVWKMNKPRGCLTTKRDPKGRRTVFDLLRDLFDASKSKEIEERFIYVGRLDYNSEGLLLFTNDGDFSRKLELPSTGLMRSYKVRFRGALTSEKIRELESGLTVDGIRYGSIKTEMITQGRTNSWVIMSLREGKNREIRKVLEYLGCTVNRLIRISYGPVSLGNLPLGGIEKLSRSEIEKLTACV